MTEAQMKTEFSKAMSYPELFTIAKKLQSQGEQIVKINKVMSLRKNQLVKMTSKIKIIETTPIQLKKYDTNSVVSRLDVDIQGNGNKIIYDGKRIILT